MNHFRQSCLVLVLLGSACNQTSSSKSDGRDETAVKAASLVSPDQVPRRCGKSGITDNSTMAVSGEYELRSGPSQSSSRIRNEKASEITHTDQYQQVDNSTTVRRLCNDGEWSEVQIVEPDWLNFVRGWVPSHFLREITKDESGARVYVADDFIWDKDTRSYQREIVASVNMIARENSRCSKIDPSSVAKSPSRSAPGNPVFFVTCNEGASAFNVWFAPGDLASGRHFAATPNIEQSSAIALCEIAAKEAAMHPSTVNFSTADAIFSQHPSGRSRLIASFKARNSFNLELTFRISCLFDGGTLIETLIAEDQR